MQVRQAAAYSELPTNPQLQSRKLRSDISFVFILCAALIFGGCSPQIRFQPGQIPQINKPSPQAMKTGEAGRKELLAQSRILRDPRYEQRVSHIVSRLLKATPAAGNWQVYILDEDTWNAMTTEGDFIYIYRGLLDDLKSDDQVAGVLAHELSHRLAQHEIASSDEQLASGLAALAAVAAGVAVASNKNATQDDINAAFGVASAVGAGFTSLRYSKVKEQEADQIGLFLMSDAGFNPQAAAQVWYTQMQKNASEGGGSDFFSTHPLDSDRYAALQKLMPLAEQRYRSALMNNEEDDNSNKRAPPKINEIASKSLKEGNELLENSDYPRALSVAQSLVSRYPSFSDGFNLLGLVQIKMGDPNRAEQYFTKGLKLAPSDPTLLYNHACVLSLKGNQDAALSKFEKAVKLDPSLAIHAKEDTDLFALHENPRFLTAIKNAANQPPAKGKAKSTFSVNRGA